MPGFAYPHIAGMDMAGTVIDEWAADVVRSVAVGDRVVVDPSLAGVAGGSKLAGRGDLYGELGIIGATVDGGYAELCLVPASHVYPVPDDMPLEHAATFPTCYLTAAHALFDVGRLEAGETVMIHAAGSGVSVAAIQLAKHAGATVLATAGSDDKLDRAAPLGADHVCNNRTDDVTGFARGVTHGPRRRHGVRPRRHRPLRARRCSPSASGVGWSTAATPSGDRPRSRRSATCSTRASRSRARTRTAPRSSARCGRRSATPASRWRSTASSARRSRRRPGQDAGERLLRQDPPAAVMLVASRDPPYPELKKTHTMAHGGRPWTDHKPPPAAPVWAVIQGLGSLLRAASPPSSSTCSTRCATLGPSPVEPLADRARRVRYRTWRSLLDGVVALGLLDQYRDVYELNDTARRYLVTRRSGLHGRPGARGARTRTTNWTHLADTVRHGRPTHPIEDDPAAFYVPLVEGTFTTMWRTATRADLKIGYSRLGAPRVLDLGAGGAPWAIAVLQACPEAHRGRQRPGPRCSRSPHARPPSIGVAESVRVASRRLPRRRPRARPPTTSWCSATCVAPRAQTAHGI